MTRGKRLATPRIVICVADHPRYATQDEAWAVVGRLLARMIARLILAEQAKQEQVTRRRTLARPSD